MSLVNFPEFRIKKYPRGYVVEIKNKKWWGKEYWVHIISVAGMEDEPWGFTNYETAYLEAIRLINKHITQNL
jgi:hypothetical protein